MEKLTVIDGSRRIFKTPQCLDAKRSEAYQDHMDLISRIRPPSPVDELTVEAALIAQQSADINRHLAYLSKSHGDLDSWLKFNSAATKEARQYAQMIATLGIDAKSMGAKRMRQIEADKIAEDGGGDTWGTLL